MNDKIHEQLKQEPKHPAPMRLWIGIFMIIFYIGIGLLLILANQTFQIYTPAVSIVIGALLCVYGVWRGYRLWKNKP